MAGKTNGRHAKADRGTMRAEGVASKGGVILILVGLVVTGLAAGYRWWRALPNEDKTNENGI